MRVNAAVPESVGDAPGTIFVHAPKGYPSAPEPGLPASPPHTQCPPRKARFRGNASHDTSLTRRQAASLPLDTG